MKRAYGWLIGGAALVGGVAIADEPRGHEQQEERLPAIDRNTEANARADQDERWRAEKAERRRRERERVRGRRRDLNRDRFDQDRDRGLRELAPPVDANEQEQMRTLEQQPLDSRHRRR